jgi:hypothetical protein
VWSEIGCDVIKHNDRGDAIKGVSGAFMHSPKNRSKILKDFYLDGSYARMIQEDLQVDSMYADAYCVPHGVHQQTSSAE